MKKIIIITGTTRGLGKEFLNILSNENIIISINRREVIYKNDKITNILIDLSHITSNNIENFEYILAEKISRNITKLEEIVFVNNAFSMGELKKIGELKNSEIEKNININFVSSFLLIKSFINKSKSLKIEKKILNISSGASRKAIYGWSIYCTTKSAMEMLMNNILVEYNDYKCFNIDPGVMNTEMQSTIRRFKDGKDNEYFKKLYRDNALAETIVVAKRIIKEYEL